MSKSTLHIIFAFFFVTCLALLILSEPAEFSFSPFSEPKTSASDLAVLILGRAGQGEGGIWEQAPNLTDTILLADFHSETDTLNLISLPRDLYGNWGSGDFKINEAYERGEMAGLLNSVQGITGVQTKNYLVVDLSTVKDLIDGMGGLDVNLPSAVTDSVSGYTMPAGARHLSGDQTVWLIRNRYSNEGDFFREANQQLIISAAAQKFESLGLAQKTSLFFSLLPTLAKDDTNLSLGEILPQLDNLKGIRLNEIVMNFQSGLWESSSTPVGPSQMYILLPKAGIDNYADVRTYIRSRLK